MAMRRKRRFRRSFAGRKGNRDFFWLRFQPFTLGLQTTSPQLILSSVIADEVTWSNPSQDLNQTRRGGPRLERFILNWGFSVEGAQGFWESSGDANLALIPEVMVHTQPDQFATQVVSTVSFDSTLRNNRVIMHEVGTQEREFTRIDETGAGTPKYLRTVQSRYETVSKVRLAEMSVAFSLRSNFDAGTSNMLGFTDWFQPTFLISLP